MLRLAKDFFLVAAPPSGWFRRAGITGVAVTFVLLLAAAIAAAVVHGERAGAAALDASRLSMAVQRVLVAAEMNLTTGAAMLPILLPTAMSQSIGWTPIMTPSNSTTANNGDAAHHHYFYSQNASDAAIQEWSAAKGWAPAATAEAQGEPCVSGCEGLALSNATTGSTGSADDGAVWYYRRQGQTFAAVELRRVLKDAAEVLSVHAKVNVRLVVWAAPAARSSNGSTDGSQVLLAAPVDATPTSAPAASSVAAVSAGSTDVIVCAWAARNAPLFPPTAVLGVLLGSLAAGVVAALAVLLVGLVRFCTTHRHAPCIDAVNDDRGLASPPPLFLAAAMLRCPAAYQEVLGDGLDAVQAAFRLCVRDASGASGCYGVPQAGGDSMLVVASTGAAIEAFATRLFERTRGPPFLPAATTDATSGLFVPPPPPATVLVAAHAVAVTAATCGRYDVHRSVYAYPDAPFGLVAEAADRGDAGVLMRSQPFRVAALGLALPMPSSTPDLDVFGSAIDPFTPGDPSLARLLDTLIVVESAASSERGGASPINGLISIDPSVKASVDSPMAPSSSDDCSTVSINSRRPSVSARRGPRFARIPALASPVRGEGPLPLAALTAAPPSLAPVSRIAAIFALRFTGPSWASASAQQSAFDLIVSAAAAERGMVIGAFDATIIVAFNLATPVASAAVRAARMAGVIAAQRHRGHLPHALCALVVGRATAVTNERGTTYCAGGAAAASTTLVATAMRLLAGQRPRRTRGPAMHRRLSQLSRGSGLPNFPAFADHGAGPMDLAPPSHGGPSLGASLAAIGDDLALYGAGASTTDNGGLLQWLHHDEPLHTSTARDTKTAPGANSSSSSPPPNGYWRIATGDAHPTPADSAAPALGPAVATTVTTAASDLQHAFALIPLSMTYPHGTPPHHRHYGHAGTDRRTSAVSLALRPGLVVFALGQELLDGGGRPSASGGEWMYKLEELRRCDCHAVAGDLFATLAAGGGSDVAAAESPLVALWARLAAFPQSPFYRSHSSTGTAAADISPALSPLRQAPAVVPVSATHLSVRPAHAGSHLPAPPMLLHAIALAELERLYPPSVVRDYATAHPGTVAVASTNSVAGGPSLPPPPVIVVPATATPTTVSSTAVPPAPPQRLGDSGTARIVVGPQDKITNRNSKPSQPAPTAVSPPHRAEDPPRPAPTGAAAAGGGAGGAVNNIGGLLSRSAELSVLSSESEDFPYYGNASSGRAGIATTTITRPRPLHRTLLAGSEQLAASASTPGSSPYNPLLPPGMAMPPAVAVASTCASDDTDSTGASAPSPHPRDGTLETSPPDICSSSSLHRLSSSGAHTHSGGANAVHYYHNYNKLSTSQPRERLHSIPSFTHFDSAGRVALERGDGPSPALTTPTITANNSLPPSFSQNP